jgi:predicted AlkP superfamily phosphohydrolase/phosphomutase
MSSKARVMVIALDAADPGLVRALARAGEMPAMASFLARAAAVPTLAPAGVFVSANWPTIFTASFPDRHGYLCWNEYVGGTYDYRETDPTMVRGTPFWETLSEAGRRVAVIDVPHSLARPVNGAMLVEWGCHDRHLGTASWPEGLAGDLSERYGAHFGTAEPPGRDQFAPCDYVHRAGAERSDDESAALFDDICRGIELKRLASLDLLDRGGWDLFLTVLGESHCVGHQLWHLHDPSHPRHDPSLAARLGGDPVRDVYLRLDAVVGDHLARLGPEDTAYVLFAHGMTAHNDGTHLLDHVLHRLDWGLDEPGGLGAATQAAAEVARLVPSPLRPRALRALAPLLRERVRGADPGVVPPLPERRWFSTPNNTVVGAVRLNLAGREPCGRIHPSDRRDVLRWLSCRLMELVNVDTGGRVVRGCVVADDVYRRTPGDAFGDLYIEWERSAPIERVWSPAVGTVAVPYDHWRQGDHVREGLVLACGPGIQSGRRRGTFHTADLGATFSAALGVPLPDVDGTPIASILPGGVDVGGVAPRPGAGRAGRALTRRAGRRVPKWARRQDPALPRMWEDLAARAEAAQSRAEFAGEQASLANAGLAELNAELDQRLVPLERGADVAAMTAWLPHAEVPSDLLVSVVMATRDRCETLPEAIASVEAQAYTRWELLVVDDGSNDGTADFLAGITDPRVTVLKTPGIGPCGARNAGLDVAHGNVITYLDDDNLFDPQWLKAVASTFAALPDTSVCYGARVFDDEGRALRGSISGKAGLHFLEWDPEEIRLRNLADMNVLAHRRSDVRFDEQLAYYGDWDLLLQLAKDVTPVELPAIAVYYRTHAPGRLSATLPPEEMHREYRIIRQKLDGGTAQQEGLVRR